MPSPAMAALRRARPPSIQPMIPPDLSAAFSSARSVLAILKNSDSQPGLLDELSSELRELVVEAVDDWLLFGDGFECVEILEHANDVGGRIKRALSPEPIVDAEDSDRTDGESARSTDDESPTPSPGIPSPEAKDSSPDDLDALLVASWS